MRLVRVNGPWVGLELGRNGEPGMPECEQDVTEPIRTPRGRAAADLELEAAVDGGHAVDPIGHDARVPAASPAKLVDVAQELVDRRSVAVAGGLHERRQLAASNRLSGREARERPRVAVAVALGAHAHLADRRGARTPRADGVRIGVEDRNLGRLDTSVPEGLVGDEAGQAAADDRDAGRLGSWATQGLAPT